MESLLEKTNIARQKGRYWRKIRNISFLVLLLGFFCWVGLRFYYPVEKGSETGKLNYVVYKGQVFKTYEGMLIRSEQKLSMDGEVILSEFKFSIAKKSLAEQLMHVGDKTVEIRYSKYFGSIPWRGSSCYVVNGIVAISEEIDPVDQELITVQIGGNR